MTSSIASVSQIELTQRRQKLRQQRRVRILQTSWRNVAIGGLAGGSVWIATLPNWVIRNPDQVTIQGNQFIPAQTIRSLLPISYPQSLLRLEPQTIVRELKSKAPLSEVTINRHLFPPELVVQVKERYPVAIAFLTPADAQSLSSRLSKPSLTKSSSTPSSIGLLDDSGMWIPLQRFTAIDRSLKLPDLKVIGQQAQHYPYWPGLYQAVHRSPVKVLEINLQNPANVILKTEMGMVHFGSYSSQFTYQLNVLDRMRKLPTRLNLDQIAYIDLRNPETPIVQMIPSKNPVKLNTP
jgi:cell division protein FtsQ